MQTASDLKLVLLQILEDVFQDNSNVQATQQMGVQLSNAVKREGVVIIQNQNVEIFSKMMPLMVKALKICDLIESPKNQIIEVQKVLPPPIDIDIDPIDDCCNWLYENNFKWSAMQDLMKARYLEFVTGKFKTKIEAAKWLGVGSTYLCKLTKKPNEKDLTDAGNN
jgi:hypothetical protein